MNVMGEDDLAEAQALLAQVMSQMEGGTEYSGQSVVDSLYDN